jgi:hypothetical protein
MHKKGLSAVELGEGMLPVSGAKELRTRSREVERMPGGTTMELISRRTQCGLPVKKTDLAHTVVGEG